MGGIGKSYYQHDESSMGPNKLHPETARGAVEQHPSYPSPASRRKRTQTSNATAIYTPTAGVRRDNIIRRDITYTVYK